MGGAGNGIRIRDVLPGKLPGDKPVITCWSNRLSPF